MCDTLVALPPATCGDSIVFGKNSDRPCEEGQSVVRKPRAHHEPGSVVRCTYIEISQVETTHAVLLSQPDWMWGAEMGANEHGVVVGNEAVWTNEPYGPESLLGMDLLRLGLERASSALELLEVVTDLLERYGQGGGCAEGDPSFTYHNSFLIVDPNEAWVLETAGRQWVAERVTRGVRTITNELSIGSGYDRASEGLLEHVVARGLYSGTGPIDFAASFRATPPDPDSRGVRSRRELEARAGSITPETMIELLGDHESGLCMHGGFATTASMVSALGGEGCRHWMTGAPHPCRAPFHPVPVEESGT